MRSWLLAIGFAIVSTPVLATTHEEQVCREVLDPSSFVVKANDVDRLRSKLNIDADHAYFLLSLYAAKKGLQPISNFQVGAAGVTESGDVILGSNIELKGTQLGQGLHAERTVIALANETSARIKTLYSSVTPCGGCRQWLNEVNGGAQMEIVSKGNDGLYKRTLTGLLPEDFGPHHLGANGILDGQRARWTVKSGDLEAPLREALENSYAPYSKQPSGAAITLKNGVVYTGSYIENAAYDSYPALTIALAKMVMSGNSDFSQIDNVVVVSASTASGGQNNVDHFSSNRTVAFSEALGSRRLGFALCLI